MLDLRRIKEQANRHAFPIDMNTDEMDAVNMATMIETDKDKNLVRLNCKQCDEPITYMFERFCYLGALRGPMVMLCDNCDIYRIMVDRIYPPLT